MYTYMCVYMCVCIHTHTHSSQLSTQDMKYAICGRNSYTNSFYGSNSSNRRILKNIGEYCNIAFPHPEGYKNRST